MIDKIETFCLNILRKIKLGKLADIYLEHQEGMRYLVFGVLSTIVNILVFSILYSLVQLSTTASNVIAWIISVIFAYITNKLWVFDSKVNDMKDLIKEVMSFIGARVFTLVIETILLNVTIDILGWNSVLMKIISNIIVIIMNFVFSKLFIFKKSKGEENG